MNKPKELSHKRVYKLAKIGDILASEPLVKKNVRQKSRALWCNKPVLDPFICTKRFGICLALYLHVWQRKERMWCFYNS